MCDVKEFLFFVIYFTLDLILAVSNFGEIFNNLAITFFHGGIDIVNYMLAVLPPPLMQYLTQTCTLWKTISDW